MKDEEMGSSALGKFLLAHYSDMFFVVVSSCAAKECSTPLFDATTFYSIFCLQVLWFYACFLCLPQFLQYKARNAECAQASYNDSSCPAQTPLRHHQILSSSMVAKHPMLRILIPSCPPILGSTHATTAPRGVLPPLLFVLTRRGQCRNEHKANGRRLITTLLLRWLREWL